MASIGVEPEGHVRTRTTVDAARQLTVPVAGMTCASCEARVRKALTRLPGVETVTVSAPRGSATIRGGALPARRDIDAAVRSAGYEPTAAPWLSHDAALWRTVLLAGLAVAVAVAAAVAGGIGPSDLTSRLGDPARGGLLVVLALGLGAGVSTCMALVGGLVLGFSASHAASLTAGRPTAPPLTTRLRPQLAFNLGRIAGFAVLGAALGALGSTMSLPTRAMAVLVLVVAVVMFVLGLRLTGISPRVGAWSPRLPVGVARLLGVDTAAQAPYSHTRTALIGAATFVLPCGFTQAVQIYALSTASPLTAGAVMATFAVGTTPGLLALGSLPELTTGPRQVTVLRAVGVLVLAFSLLNVSSAVNLLGLRTAAATSAARTVSGNVTVAAGIQTVRMTQVAGGYEPADSVVYAGLHTRWAIDATSPFDCSAYLRVPALGVEVDLAPGPNTVDLPVLEAGTVPFTCVMGMYSGTLVVIDQPTAGVG